MNRPSLPGRLSADRIDAARARIDPRLVDTPRWSDPALSSWLGCELVVKDETQGPLACFKGRGADLFVGDLVAAGPVQAPLVCASAGNFGLALVDAGRRRGVPVVVFAATAASPHKLARIRALGAEVVLRGADFDAAKAAARAHAAATGGTFVEDGAPIPISEGAGTIGPELGDLALDAVVVPVGNGALIAGVGAWLRARRPTTRVIGVCAAGAPVMREVWRRGLGAAVGARADTIADGIAVRVPVAAAVDDLAAVIDDMVLVDDAALLAAMQALHAARGAVAEPSAVAGIAAIATDRARFAGVRVATILTGSNLGDDQRARWLSR
jgi:threonine dehydratase